MHPKIVLVHGAFAESASRNGVVDRRVAEGRDDIAAANSLRGLASDAAVVSDLVRSIEGPVVLVAHSYGGAVISNVDAGAGEIAGLVYVNGFAPEPGENCFGLAAMFPDSMLGQETAPAVSRQGPNDRPLHRFGQLPGHLLPGRPRGADRAHGRHAAPRTQEALVEPSGERTLWKDLPSWFLIGGEDHIIPAALQRYMAERARAQRTIAVEGASHAALVSHTGVVAELILDAVPVSAAA
jgi:pimeloyl-ACP methyl ester carboxylesterase